MSEPATLPPNFHPESARWALEQAARVTLTTLIASHDAAEHANQIATNIRAIARGWSTTPPAEQDKPVTWSSELEEARVTLCHFWLEVADNYPELAERAIETEQALTILGEYANAYAHPDPRVQELEEALENTIRDMKRVARELQQGNTKKYASEALLGFACMAERDLGTTGGEQ